METDKKDHAALRPKPLRLLPAIVIVILQWLIRFGLPGVVSADLATQIGIFGGLIGGVAIMIWWAFFSRAIWF